MMKSHRNISVIFLVILGLMLLLPLGGFTQEMSHALDDVPIEEPVPESFLAFLYRGLGLRYTFWFALLYLLQAAAWIASIVVLFTTGSRPSVVTMTAAAKGQSKDLWDALQTDRSYAATLVKEVVAVPGISGVQASRLLATKHVCRLTNSRVILRYSAFIGALALLIGLYGTVDGLLAMFQVITNPKLSNLIEGLNYSLVPSYLGLGIACSSTFWFGVFSAIHSRRMAAAHVAAEELVCRLLPERAVAR